MKAFINSFGRLCAVTMLVCSNSLLTWGHDLPRDRSLPHEATLNCFSAASHRSQSRTSRTIAAAEATPAPQPNVNPRCEGFLLNESPFMSPTASLLHAWHTGLSQASQISVAISATLDRMRVQMNKPQFPDNSDLALAAPDQGVAPRPRSKRVTPQAASLGQFLKQIDDAQCQISDFLQHPANLQIAIAEQTHGWYQFLNRAAVKFLPVEQPALALGAPTIGPQYVIFETSAGGHILLTMAQAQQWQFAVPAAKASAANYVSTLVEPIRQQAFEAFSGKLEWAGRTLLELSQTVSSFSNSKVANRGRSYR